MLLRLPYLALSTAVGIIRLLPMSNHEKDLEILALRHQLVVLQRQTGKPPLTWPDRALLAALLHHLPHKRLRQLHLIVSPDTVLRKDHPRVGGLDCRTVRPAPLAAGSPPRRRAGRFVTWGSGRALRFLR